MEGVELTLYFDGKCPFCVAEMQRLRRWDRQSRLGFVDISEPHFDPTRLDVDLATLNRELHSWTSEGRRLVGIDSMVAAYTLVGRGWLVAPLRARRLRPMFRVLYRVFARNRQRISSWLGMSIVPACTAGSCSVDSSPFTKKE